MCRFYCLLLFFNLVTIIIRIISKILLKYSNNMLIIYLNASLQFEWLLHKLNVCYKAFSLNKDKRTKTKWIMKKGLFFLTLFLSFCLNHSILSSVHPGAQRPFIHARMDPSTVFDHWSFRLSVLVHVYPLICLSV